MGDRTGCALDQRRGCLSSPMIRTAGGCSVSITLLPTWIWQPCGSVFPSGTAPGRHRDPFRRAAAPDGGNQVPAAPGLPTLGRPSPASLSSGLTPSRDYHFLSLDHRLLQQLAFTPREACIPIARVNSGKVRRMAEIYGWGGVAGHYALIRRRQVAALHRRGFRVGTGFVNSANSLHRELNRGVDWLFSDRPLVFTAPCIVCSPGAIGWPSEAIEFADDYGGRGGRARTREGGVIRRKGSRRPDRAGWRRSQRAP